MKTFTNLTLTFISFSFTFHYDKYVCDRANSVPSLNGRNDNHNSSAQYSSQKTTKSVKNSSYNNYNLDPEKLSCIHPEVIKLLVPEHVYMSTFC